MQCFFTREGLSFAKRLGQDTGSRRVALKNLSPIVHPASPSASATPTGRGFRKRLSRWRWRQWALALLFLLLAPVIAVTIFYTLWAGTFDISRLGEMPQRATVYDMDGNPYSRINYGANRIVVPLDKVSRHFVDALVAREDARFYSHHGVDPRGILRAVIRNVSRGRAAEGASTLTQQLARNSLPLGGKTINRKILEAFVALRIERHYNKKQILEFYVNRIFYGGALYGVETASQAYFGKPSAQLDLSESAMMAGLIRSPNRFSPLNNLKGATRERDTVLGRMSQLGKITPTEAEKAKKETIRPARQRLANVQENYAMQAIQRELNTLLSDEQTDDGGLKIYTTIDPQLQTLATQAIETQLTKIENRPGYDHPKKANLPADRDENAGTDYLQGALVAIDNRDGAVRALVGGREYKPDAFNRATDAPGRQVGSTFKPFLYTAAWQRGLLPGANIDDGPIRPGELKDAPTWSPGNSDGQFGGVQPAEVGLIRSRNTMSVRVGELVGVEEVRQVGLGVGLGENIPALPVIFLGAFNATLKDITTAYTLFPNHGVQRTPYFIERIDDVDGQTLYRAAHNDRPVLQSGAAWLTNSILQKVMQKGTAAEARSLGFTKPAGGKTGTTNDYKDAWFVGYTSSLTCGVWVGLDKPQTIMTKGYGATLALPIWCQVMGKASGQRYPATELRPPEPLRKTRVCAYSNQLATSGCEAAGAAYSIDLPASMADNMTRQNSICEHHQGRLLPAEGNEPFQPQAAPSPEDDRQPRSDPFPKRFLRSFKRFFGG
jgi:penicillin-binding protein 1A